MNRKLDELGRLVIPIEYRKELEIENGSSVEIELKNKRIVITNPNKIDYKEKYECLLKTLKEKK